MKNDSDLSPFILIREDEHDEHTRTHICADMMDCLTCFEYIHSLVYIVFVPMLN
jgi:hypothetical protein